MRILILVLTVLCLIGLPVTGWARDYALVVGIGDFIEDGSLKRPSSSLSPMSTNSAKAMAQLFLDMGLAPEDVILLLDQTATKQAIFAGLAKLTTAATPDSTVYFYFADHGLSGLLDTDGDEPDNMDEGLVPADAQDGNAYYGGYEYDPEIKAQVDASFISDDEINAHLTALAGKAKTVVAIFESCFSGGVPKALGGLNPEPRFLTGDYRSAVKVGQTPLLPDGVNLSVLLGETGQVPTAQLTAPPQQGHPTRDTWGVGDTLYYEGQTTQPNLIVLTACEPMQLCKYLFNIGHGVFTYGLINTIYKDDQQADFDKDGHLSWYEVGTYTHYWVGQEMDMQTAQAGITDPNERESMLQYPVLYNAPWAGVTLVPDQALGLARNLDSPVVGEFYTELEQYMRQGGGPGLPEPPPATGQLPGMGAQDESGMLSVIAGYVARDLEIGAQAFAADPSTANLMFLAHRTMVLEMGVYGIGENDPAIEQLATSFRTRDPAVISSICQQLSQQAADYIQQRFGVEYAWQFNLGREVSDLEYTIWQATRFQPLRADGKYVAFQTGGQLSANQAEPYLSTLSTSLAQYDGQQTKLTTLMLYYLCFQQALAARYGIVPAAEWVIL